MAQKIIFHWTHMPTILTYYRFGSTGRYRYGTLPRYSTVLIGLFSFYTGSLVCNANVDGYQYFLQCHCSLVTILWFFVVWRWGQVGRYGMVGTDTVPYHSRGWAKLTLLFFLQTTCILVQLSSYTYWYLPGCCLHRSIAFSVVNFRVGIWYELGIVGK